MKQNDVHKVSILYLYTKGRNDWGGGGKHLVGAKRLGGKRLGGETTRGRNGLGAKHPGFGYIIDGTNIVTDMVPSHRCVWCGFEPRTGHM